ncbi:MAG: methyltransferase domain-containing protein [Candidatus Kariarchaeaceae archaeon]
MESTVGLMLCIKPSRIVPSDEFLQASKYDQMIPWEKRLTREIPVIREHLHNGSVLDIACSSGRHSLALENEGFTTFGIDISEGMIAIANSLASEQKAGARFVAYDAAAADLLDCFQEQEYPSYFDNAILLGNSIANLGTKEKGEQLLRNAFLVVRPGGRFFVQTVQRPEKPHYTPLRQIDDQIIQRIMVPVWGEQYNAALHVNIIDPRTHEYISKKNDNHFFMYTRFEFEDLVTQVGWQVKELYGGYAEEPVSEVDGATQVWILEKPEIPLYPETKDLFRSYAQMEPEEIRQQTQLIWQQAMRVHQYHCIRGYRFLYPRITSHTRYQDMLGNIAQKWILDLGCNLGTDLRQLIVDGADPAKLVGVDLQATFIELGYQLFNDRQSLTAQFFDGDILDTEFLDPTLKSGTFSEFLDRFDLIHAGSLLHLLSKEENELLFSKIGHLLKPGGIFAGRAVGKSQPENIEHPGGFRHLYSPASLQQHLSELDFKEVEVTVLQPDAPLGERSTSEHLAMAFYAQRS